MDKTTRYCKQFKWQRSKACSKKNPNHEINPPFVENFSFKKLDPHSRKIQKFLDLFR